MTPFEYSGLKKTHKSNQGKISFDESYIDHGIDEHGTIEGERENINYRLIGFLLLFGFILLFSRLYFLQVVKTQQYRALAEGNKNREEYIIAPRGLITDQYGKIIVDNIPSFELVAMPADMPADDQELSAKLASLASITGHDPKEFADLAAKMDRKSFQAQTLAENITKDAALTIIGQAEAFHGFEVQNNPIREYKDPQVFSHLVGYTGKVTEDELKKHENQNYLLNDYIGKTAAEYQFEDFLRGEAGQKPTEIDAQGRFIKDLPDIPALPGNNVKLNIDYDLQKALYDSIQSQLQKYHKSRAAAVVTNPQTGEVLALVSVPGFDNNLFARGIKSQEYAGLLNDPDIPLLDRVISGTYAPGSTVKPMITQAALTEGIVTPETIIVDTGSIRVGNTTFSGYDRSGLGPMNAVSAIARSSDIYFYTVGAGNNNTGFKGLGVEKLAEWYRKFHLGAALGIDLPNEKGGLVPDTAWKLENRGEPWYLGNTYNLSIGQGDLLVTPLQVNSWTATIANGGKIMQPFILDEVTDREGKVIKQGQSTVLAENFLDPKWIGVVQEGMRQTVASGTARLLNALPFPTSGKTGTAQIISKNLTTTHAWFTAYGPTDNPQLAVTVLVEAGGEGGTLSAPVARDVFAWWAQNRWQK